MEQTVSRLLKGYENGRLSRRDVVQALALLAAGAGTATAAGFEGRGIHHVSLYVSDVQRSSEFYSRVFACQAQARQDGTVAISLGKSHIVLRRGNPPGKVDHFSIGVDHFDKDSVIRDLKSRGATPIDEGGDSGLHVMDPNGFPVQLSANDAA